MIEMTLQQIMYFIEVTNTQHFTKAAQNLFVSQSSLSHAIQLLEKELEVPLFIRKSGKRVMLTSYAEKLLPHCQKVVQELTVAQEEIDSMRNPFSGVVTVAYSYMNCASLIPAVFKQFYADNNYEDIKVDFEINHQQKKIEEELLQGNVDLVFSCTTGIDGIQQEAINKQELFVMLPVSHPLASRKSLTIEDVSDEQMICYYYGWNLSNWIENMFKAHDLKPNYSQVVTSWSSQVTLVSLELGIAICPKLPVDSSLVCYVTLDDPMRFRNVYISWADKENLRPAVKYIRDYCLDYFQEKMRVEN